MATEPIVFYDIPSRAPGSAMSGNTWITRYSLNFKGLAFKTMWVEIPDIGDLCKKIGAAPSAINEDGSPYYTLPVIQDPNTGAVIADSLKIASYLDETYPDTPRLLPPGTRALQKGFRAGVEASAVPGSLAFMLPAMVQILRPRSAEYFVRTREASLGHKLSELSPTSETREAAWRKFESGFGKVSSWMDDDGVFFMGDTASLADFAVAGIMQWFRSVLGRESAEWKDIERWHGGRWAKLVSALQKYEGPVEKGPQD
ncbi:hypothetical protein FB45DRAFT_292487 [Roridomyces roridus]|uniref:GST N-terminal domain-containing protein n=1 Tax=Roridomyces roridus TaxID=1738132 RepID=A0AAD7CB90_9AGAR|nr:hypothetical protein FB45DRAFT_292487 [Roridomyces roridus]